MDVILSDCSDGMSTGVILVALDSKSSPDALSSNGMNVGVAITSS